MTEFNAITNKLYRYDSLLKAIDFFTQRFNFEQISEFAFEFSNEIVTLHSSALFIREENHYVLKKKRFYKIDNYSLENTVELENIPLFHGHIITNNFKSFFHAQIVQAFEMKVVIPLIIDSELYGFIVSNGKIMGDLEDDDYHILSALMRLFNNSLENFKYLEDLKRSNAILDQKLFNLFVINQSTKVLLSELDMEKLASIATDVFSEVSGSQVTTLGIYDELSSKIKLSSYRNVRSFTTYMTEIELHTRQYSGQKIVLEIDKDLDIIKELFVNWEEFTALDTKYIILIVRDTIQGFVTLSESMNQCTYDQSMFELIESLASSTYIAIENAKMFKIIGEQKEKIEKKLSSLEIFNRVIKTINQCKTDGELINLTLKMLRLHFGVKKALFLSRNKDCYEVKDDIGIFIKKESFYLNENWDDVVCGESVSHFNGKEISTFFSGASFLEKIIDGNCLVISPILHDSLDEQCPLGFLVVVELNENLKEGDVLFIDTLAGNITPILYQMAHVSQIKADYIEDRKKSFLKHVEQKIQERVKYDLPFYLYYKRAASNPFESKKVDICENEHAYCFDQYIFITSYEKLSDPSFTELMIDSMEDLKNMSFK